MDTLRIVNEIGKFSKKNMAFLNRLKNEGIDFDNEKKTNKSIISTNGCEIIFDYDNLDIKMKGKCIRETELLEEIY